MRTAVLFLGLFIAGFLAMWALYVYEVSRALDAAERHNDHPNREV